ncbi:MAG: PEGA domain-containing protein [Pseudomonadota bacterium]
MRFAILGLIVILCSGCLTTSGARKIVTNPEGALVTVQGLGDCETPCTIKLDRIRYITVAKAGYEPYRFTLGPEGPTVKLDLQLVAETESVDETGLPDLQ